MDLSAIRRFAGLTQTALAKRMGTEQTVVSRLERQSDWKLSTLVDYLLGTGLDVRLVLSGPDSSAQGDLVFVLSRDTRRFIEATRLPFLQKGNQPLYRTPPSTRLGASR